MPWFLGGKRKERNVFRRGKNMNELQNIIKSASEKFGLEILYYLEKSAPHDMPVCDRQFEEVTDDGTHTFFRFTFRSASYIGILSGTSKEIYNYATLLPPYIESFVDREAELSKSEHLKRILLGECSSLGIYKYGTKYSVRGSAGYVLAIRVPKMMKETIALIEQYGGNSLDSVVQMNEELCVLVKFFDGMENEDQSSVDYAKFLAQSIKEELGVDVTVGVGTTVYELKDLFESYVRAEDVLRYVDVFESKNPVHSHREFILVKMLEDIPQVKLEKYFSELSYEGTKEIFEDEEMLSTAEEFLRNSLNVSETSRNLYMHRNTLLYRLDKIEKATGMNIRSFSDAVSFRVLTVIYRLLGK